MVKKIRFQENRSDPRQRKQEPRSRWVFEPLDWALVAAVALVALWLQWLMAVLPG